MITHLVRYTLKGEDRRLDLKPQHLEYLDKLYQSGQLLAAGIFQNKVGGYLLFRTSTYEETKLLVDQDPYIIYGARNYEIETWDMSPFPLRLIDG